jgi:branched-chain amino acid transport system substrate-binding protein
MKSTGLSALIASLLVGAAAFADDKIVKLGQLDDQSSLYADSGGPGSVLAVNMAVEDSGLRDKGWTINIVSADHLNKPDVGVGIARQWFDVDKVDAIIDRSGGPRFADARLQADRRNRQRSQLRNDE